LKNSQHIIEFSLLHDPLLLNVVGLFHKVYAGVDNPGFILRSTDLLVPCHKRQGSRGMSDSFTVMKPKGVHDDFIGVPISDSHAHAPKHFISDPHMKYDFNSEKQFQLRRITSCHLVYYRIMIIKYALNQ
jgi:hypothetical protein